MYNRTPPGQLDRGEILVTPMDTPSPFEGVPTSTVRASSRANISCSSIAIIVRRPETGEFKGNGINTAIHHPHSSSKKKMTIELPPSPPAQKSESAIAVYCGSLTGTQTAFSAAAVC